MEWKSPNRPDDWGQRESHPHYSRWTWHKRVGMVPEWSDDFWSFVSSIGECPDGHALRKRNPREPIGPSNWYWKKSNPSKDKAAYARGWRRENPRKSRSIDLKKMFGITIEQYDEMLRDQGGVCKICGEAERRADGAGRYTNLSVDHCHSTGRVRGLLCSSCNRGLGFFKDRPDLIDAAAAYLRT